MTPTRMRTLLVLGLLAFAVTWALLTVVYAILPPLTWTSMPALLVAAGAEAWLGRDLRSRILRERGGRPVASLFVARIVALAKASSLTAALLAGVFAGFMGYLSRLTSAATPRSDLVYSSLSFGASLILLAAALYLEYCCRVPKKPGRGEDGEPSPPPPLPPHH